VKHLTASPQVGVELTQIKSANALFPVAITDHTASALLEIAWNDGSRSLLPHGLLRVSCRCALCVQTRRQTNHQPEMSAMVRLTEINPIGQQGLNLVFSDGHGRGIFPWSYLHELETAAV
jgi:DUF971 family protein